MLTGRLYTPANCQFMLSGHYAQNLLPRVLSDGDSVRQHGVKGQVLAITSYTLAAPVGVRLPSCVAFVPNDFLARNTENVPIPQTDVRVLVVHVLNQCTTPTEDRHAVATLDSTFLLTDGIPTFAPLHE